MKKSLFILLLTCVLITGTSCEESSSIGIIGGADGPTSIIVGKKSDTTTYDEMPDLDGIPTPPGTFETAWKSDDGMIYIEMSGISDDIVFHTYVGTTLYDAGFNSVWEQNGEEVEGKSHRDKHIRCEDDERSILLTWIDDTLTMTVTEK